MDTKLPTIAMGTLEDRVWKCMDMKHYGKAWLMTGCSECSSLFSIIEAYDAYYYACEKDTMHGH